MQLLFLLVKMPSIRMAYCFGVLRFKRKLFSSLGL